MPLIKALGKLLAPTPRVSKDPMKTSLAAFQALQRSDLELAELLIDPILASHGDHPDVLLVQGLLHRERRRFESALTCFRRATSFRPDFAAAWVQQGVLLREASRLAEARIAFEHAATYKPASAEIHQNLGLLCYLLGDVPKAVEALEKAVALAPGLQEARFDLAQALLSAGQFEKGWAEYEHRPHLSDAMQGIRGTRWRPGNRTSRIAVIGEQGFGDVLLSLGLLPRLRAQASELIVAVQQPLMALIRESRLADAVIRLEDAQDGDRYDAYLPIMSLPLATRLSVSEINHRAPYLSVEPLRLSRWHELLGGRKGKLRVGLAWGGNPSNGRDRERSIQTEILAPLGEVRNVDWYRLQIGRADLGIPPFPLIDFTAELTDFADTAALISNLDLVISVDTAVAHLAGALGKSVWVLTPLHADWRWEIDGRASPWYDSAQIFRAKATSEWAPVLARVVQALRERVEHQG